MRYSGISNAALWVLSLGNIQLAAAGTKRSCALPTVDLGYEIHQAITLDV